MKYSGYTQLSYLWSRDRIVEWNEGWTQTICEAIVGRLVKDQINILDDSDLSDRSSFAFDFHFHPLSLPGYWVVGGKR